MNFSFYLNKIITEEEFEFIFDLMNQIIEYGDSMTIFVTDNACYQINVILEKLNDILEYKNFDSSIRTYVNGDVFKSLGLILSNFRDIMESKYASFIENDIFNLKYIELNSDLEHRHFKFS